MITTTDEFKPSDLAREIHRAQIQRIEDERHEREILTYPGVAEGFVEANRLVDEWRRTIRRNNLGG